MKIWIDADACPRVIKEICFAPRHDSRCRSAWWPTRISPGTNGLIESIVVEDGFDVADDYIVEHAAPEDLVITADIPLAARIVAKGGVALDPRGELYTEENVGERLSIRDLMMELRSGGLVQGAGPVQPHRPAAVRLFAGPFADPDAQELQANDMSLCSSSTGQLWPNFQNPSAILTMVSMDNSWGKRSA